MSVVNLVLVRGLPGAGKTTIAKKLKKVDQFGYLNHPICVAADDFFMVDGEYQFNRDKLGEAHTWCQDQALQALKVGLPVVVHNTFCERWEMEPYFRMATKYRMPMQVIDVFDGGLTDEELAERNTHGVPLEAIEAMRSRWEEDWQNGNPLPPWER